MTNLEVEFCTNCSKPTCKHGECNELKNYIKNLRKRKLLKSKGGKQKKCCININLTNTKQE